MFQMLKFAIFWLALWLETRSWSLDFWKNKWGSRHFRSLISTQIITKTTFLSLYLEDEFFPCSLLRIICLYQKVDKTKRIVLNNFRCLIQSKNYFFGLESSLVLSLGIEKCFLGRWSQHWKMPLKLFSISRQKRTKFYQ